MTVSRAARMPAVRLVVSAGDEGECITRTLYQDASNSVVVIHSTHPAFDRGAPGGKPHAHGAAIRSIASPGMPGAHPREWGIWDPSVPQLFAEPMPAPARPGAILTEHLCSPTSMPDSSCGIMGVSFRLRGLYNPVEGERRHRDNSDGAQRGCVRTDAASQSVTNLVYRDSQVIGKFVKAPTGAECGGGRTD